MTHAASDTLEADVVVVGAGAAGAAAAWRLAGHGVDVLCLEQGERVDPADYATLRPDWEAARQRRWHPNPNIRRRPEDYPVDDGDCPIRPLIFNGVGGSTVMWSCHMPRMHPSDFVMHSQDGVGVDWPIRYADLDPYYALNERMMGTSGLAGDPAYPPKAPPVTGPLPIGAANRRLAAAFETLGWPWWPADLAVLSAPVGGRGACNHCGPCELGCPTGAKASVDVTYWPAAIGAGARLVTGARVREIEIDGNGRARGVVFRDRAGVTRRARAGRVLVAANGLGTPRLLLLSRSGRFPDGLANRTGLVGRHLMLHPLARVTGLFDAPLMAHRGITAGALVTHAFYETDPATGFKRGFKMQFFNSHGPALVAGGSLGRRLPWGRDHHTRFRDWFGHAASLSICADDLPDPDNRVTLSDRLADGDGLPAPAMHYRVGDNSRRILDAGLARAREAMAAAGATETIDMALVADAGFHLMGTTRMGDDPETSVVDRWGEAHDVPGLFVIDGGVFPTGAAVNPTNTLQALALRTADRLTGRA